MTVRLAKARTISVLLDGKDQSLYTLAQTVGDVIRVLGVELGPDDIVSLPAGHRCPNGMALAIAARSVVEEEVPEAIPPDHALRDR